mmetsp:Transcript_49355/g.119701  ORF Transcript_49355/g.119701 Transcript_49355/m.119701 type:complete len:206 (+) Transcript_49355:2481-3098(+)
MENKNLRMNHSLMVGQDREALVVVIVTPVQQAARHHHPSHLRLIVRHLHHHQFLSQLFLPLRRRHHLRQFVATVSSRTVRNVTVVLTMMIMGCAQPNARMLDVEMDSCNLRLARNVTMEILTKVMVVRTIVSSKQSRRVVRDQARHKSSCIYRPIRTVTVRTSYTFSKRRITETAMITATGMVLILTNSFGSVRNVAFGTTESTI